jgi:hypothetical protein
MTGSIAFEGVNYSSSAYSQTVTYRLVPGSTNKTVTFNQNFVFLRERPAIVAANKIGILSLTCFGETADSVVGAYASVL